MAIQRQISQDFCHFSRWYNRRVISELTATEWDTRLSGFPEAHILQTSAWGILKSGFGWSAARLANASAGAQVLFRKLPGGFSIAYVPMGPLGTWLPDLLPALIELSHSRRAITLKVEPDLSAPPSLAQDLRTAGFRPSSHTVQPPRTLLIDLQPDEESLLARMQQKTRYNIRLAGRKGVSVRPWNDLDGFGRMMRETAARDGFGSHLPDYYRRAYQLFHPSGNCVLLVAEAEGEPLASLMVFKQQQRAWYLFGASTNLQRNKMPNYLLQWEAIRWAKMQGCSTYDLWGVPDAELETLEDEFTARADGLWGVYRFKRGFGGDLRRTIGTWDLPLRPTLYRLYDWIFRRKPA